MKAQKHLYSIDFLKEKSDVTEKKLDKIEARAKISYDGKSLFIRIPAKARDNFHITQGQYMRFYAPMRSGKIGKLQITIENGTNTG